MLFCPVAVAQQANVFASGLSFPAKIITGPAGTLLAAEVGKTPNSGRVSLLSASGSRSTLIDGLPSGLSVPNGDPDGVNGLLLDGNTLYIAIGEGDLYINGTARGTTVVNTGANGISSPIFDTLLKVDLSQSADRVASGFSLKLEDHTSLLDGNVVTLTNAAGDKATISLVTEFRFRPSADEIIQHSHPFGIAKLDSDPNHVYINDAGLNLVHQVDITTGRKHTVTSFADVSNVTGAPPLVDAVPDTIRAYGNQLLVTLLSGFPFAPGNSKVVLVDPATGTISPFISFLSSAIDIAYRPRPNGAHAQFFVLEYSGALLTGAPGRVQMYNSGTGQKIVDGIAGPTSLALDSTAGKLYISSRTEGKIYVVDIGQ